mmetsp:Transcript_286/g.961  ORF Transcript_286/g.961 Transcript_286/m.961 type:complete len:523 (-) Transcript_286:415-1983(-)
MNRLDAIGVEAIHGVGAGVGDLGGAAAALPLPPPKIAQLGLQQAAGPFVDVWLPELVHHVLPGHGLGVEHGVHEVLLGDASLCGSGGLAPLAQLLVIEDHHLKVILEVLLVVLLRVVRVGGPQLRKEVILQVHAEEVFGEEIFVFLLTGNHPGQVLVHLLVGQLGQYGVVGEGAVEAAERDDPSLRLAQELGLVAQAVERNKRRQDRRQPGQHHELHALADQDRGVEARDHAPRGVDLDERAVAVVVHLDHPSRALLRGGARVPAAGPVLAMADDVNGVGRIVLGGDIVVPFAFGHGHLVRVELGPQVEDRAAEARCRLRHVVACAHPVRARRVQREGAGRLAVHAGVEGAHQLLHGEVHRVSLLDGLEHLPGFGHQEARRVVRALLLAGAGRELRGVPVGDLYAELLRAGQEDVLEAQALARCGLWVGPLHPHVELVWQRRMQSLRVLEELRVHMHGLPLLRAEGGRGGPIGVHRLALIVAIIAHLRQCDDLATLLVGDEVQGIAILEADVAHLPQIATHT